MEDAERLVANDTVVRNKIRERKDKLFDYVGEMLQPQTEGFEHINMDMTFTYLGNNDLWYVDNICVSITMAYLYKLKQSEYLLRGMLATFLNSRRSRDAKSMNIFTHIVTEQKQQFVDKTEKKQGFGWLKFGKKDKGVQ